VIFYTNVEANLGYFSRLSKNRNTAFYART
jgi:hypothetical protein